MSASVLMSAAASARIPYFHLGAIDIGGRDVIQSFGVIVAVGVLIGAWLLRRYAEWHGRSDDDIRGLTGWITVTGFIGAHLFDVIAYQWDDLAKDPLLVFKVWKGISSYGGFLGGAMGFAFYIWWKRLPARLFADIGVVGLLPAFSIGRIGCTVVSDHVGAMVDPNKWYAPLAMNYPRELLHQSNLSHLLAYHPTTPIVTAWNLGLIEFLYLIPVNAIVLFVAFRKKRVPAGFVAVLAGVLYPPVRFFLDYLRPENTDPRYIGLTFAQWASFLVFGVAAYVAFLLLKSGKAAEVIAPTAGEAQQMLGMELKDNDEKKADVPKAKASEKKSDAEVKAEKKKLQDADDAKAAEKKAKEDADDAAANERRKKKDEEAAAKEAAAKAAKEATEEKDEAKDEKNETKDDSKV
jgi:phosphatidylglycerol:prolipoprotein diacylglycerol transferase